MERRRVKLSLSPDLYRLVQAKADGSGIPVATYIITVLTAALRPVKEAARESH